MSESKFEPLPSSYLFNSLLDKDTIILAANPRISLVMRGIMKAAKDADAPLIVELARSESDLEGGYSGMTPAEFSKRCKKTASEVGLDVWSLHADHIGIKKGTPEDIESTRQLVSGQIDAGYTPFSLSALMKVTASSGLVSTLPFSSSLPISPTSTSSPYLRSPILS